MKSLLNSLLMLLMATVLMLMTTAVFADEDKWKDCEAVIDRTMFYNEHINMKVNTAELDTRMADSPYEDIRCMARHGKLEAGFYRDNRLRLVKEMLKQDLKPDDYRVHKYMIKAFHGAHPEAVDMCDK